MHFVKPGPQKPLPKARRSRNHPRVGEELPDDATLMMEVLFDIRRNTDFIIDLLVEGR